MIQDEITQIKPHLSLMREMYSHFKQNLGFTEDAKIVFLHNDKNCLDPIGKTGYYDASSKKISIYITKRHIKDIMRSLAHELIHHYQNCSGRLNIQSEMGANYAQTDMHLREMERQAYEMGNMLFRDWTDGKTK